MDNKYVKKHSGVYLNIGKSVKQFRSEKGWTQQDLADKCEGVTRAKISKIENAKEDFMFSTLLEIASGLGVDVEKLTKK